MKVRYIPAPAVDAEGSALRRFLPVLPLGDKLVLLVRSTRTEGAKVVWVTHDTASQDLAVLRKSFGRTKVWVRSGYAVESDDGILTAPQEALDLLVEQWGEGYRLATEEEAQHLQKEAEDFEDGAAALAAAEVARAEATLAALGHAPQLPAVAPVAAPQAPKPEAVGGADLAALMAGINQLTAMVASQGERLGVLESEWAEDEVVDDDPASDTPEGDSPATD